MPSSSHRLLLQSSSPITPSTTAEPVVAVDSDVVIILATLLCALICVVGLALVARCAWLRRASTSAAGTPQPAACSKGLKKKTIRSLPKLVFESGSSSSSSNSNNNSRCVNMVDCAICLAEFVEGEEVRVLPQCGHGFHVGCVDTWLASNSSCPSCRHVLVFTRCDKCGGAGDADDLEQGAKVVISRDRDGNMFLP